MTGLKQTHISCPCGESTDAFSVQSNGWGRCFGKCGGKNFSPQQMEELNLDNNTTTVFPPEVKENANKDKTFTPKTNVFRAFKERNLLEETVKRYGVDIGNGDSYVAKYPLYDTDNNHVGNKVRRKDKQFSIEGEINRSGLFGRQAFPPGSAKAITVVEGQDDAMAAYQIMGSKYPVVSVHSASTAERDVRKDFEYLNSFDTIVFAFDADEAGSKAAKLCAGAGFPLGKVKILTLRKYKDASDYLSERQGEAFTREWWQAPTFKPDGLKMGSEMWEAIIERKEHFTTLYPWEGMNKLTYGIRLSELIVVTAETGVGKTSFLKHIEHKLLTDPDVIEEGYGVGFLHFEEPNGDTALGLLSIHNHVPYHLPDSERPEEDLRQAYDEVLNNDRVVIWDHFGSNSVDAVLDKVRHMAALGCKYMVVDHLSIIVSDQAGDERKQLDEITTKLKTLTMELDIAVIAVIHTNRQGQIRGTAGVEQLANIVVRLERDKTDPNEWRRNVTKVTVEKNRFCGYTGPACYLWYNKDTAILSELDQEESFLYETGGALREDEQGF